MHLNEVRLIGNLGGDAEKTILQNGSKTKVTFQVATQKSWKNKETGEYDSKTQWHRIVVWDGLAEHAAGLKKGERVLISGEIQYRDYEKGIGQGNTKLDVTMYVAEIVADSVRRMDRRKDADDFDQRSS